MWVFLNNSFLSIVQDREDSNRLMVRARIAGDIEAIFPEADVIEYDYSDYRYRAFLSRERVVEAMMGIIGDISYDDFKSSVEDKERYRAYLKVWSVMEDFQQKMFQKVASWKHFNRK